VDFWVLARLAASNAGAQVGHLRGDILPLCFREAATESRPLFA
jgi:hypothetical protein